MGHMLLHNVGRWNLGHHGNVTTAWDGLGAAWWLNWLNKWHLTELCLLTNCRHLCPAVTAVSRPRHPLATAPRHLCRPIARQSVILIYVFILLSLSSIQIMYRISSQASEDQINLLQSFMHALQKLSWISGQTVMSTSIFFYIFFLYKKFVYLSYYNIWKKQWKLKWFDAASSQKLAISTFKYHSIC